MTANRMKFLVWGLIACFWFVAPAAGQPKLDPGKAYVDEAKQKEKEGDLGAAIQLYQSALEAETRERERRRIERDYDDIRRKYYVELVGAAEKEQAQSLDDAIASLIEAKQLGIADAEEKRDLLGAMGSVFGRGRDFRRAVETADELSPAFVKRLADQAAEAADAGRYSAGRDLYLRARELDEAAFTDQKLEEPLTRVESLIQVDRLVREARNLIADKRHFQAKRRLERAASVLPGQPSVEVEFRRLEAEEAKYKRTRESAQEAENSGSLEEALRLYQSAMNLHPDLANTDRLPATVASLNKGADSGDLIDQAWEAFKLGRLSEAQQKFAEVTRDDPSNQDAQTGLRKTASLMATRQGKQWDRQKKFEQAEQAFQEALDQDSENEEAKRLLERSLAYKEHVRTARELYSDGNCDGSRELFAQAQDLHAARFLVDGLQTLLEGDCTQQIPLPIDALRESLRALLSGHAIESARSLEVILDQVGSGYAQVHALLGAAYCVNNNFSQDQTLLDRAKEQFRVLLSLEPDFSFPPLLFSPDVRQLLDEVRAELPSELDLNLPGEEPVNTPPIG